MKVQVWYNQCCCQGLET